MRTNLFKKSRRFRDDAGIALLTTLLLLFLMSSLLVGFSILLMSNQQLAGSNKDDVEAFYGAEAGMEQLTANLGNLFAQTYSPTLAQVNAVTTNPPAPTIPGISFTTSTGASGYTITLPPTTTYDSNGNPVPATAVVTTGPYTGLTAFLTEYTLTVNARTAMGREVKLQRTTQTVGIPAFSFGVFSDMDLSFFPGPTFNFGGRTHTNGNLYLAEGSGNTLQLSDKVDAYKDVIRTALSNGFPTQTQYPGTVSITTNPGGTTYRSLARTEGSYDPLAGSANSGWPTISTGPSPTDYNHNLIDGIGGLAAKYSTGAQQLNLGVALLGGGSTQPVDLIRRALSGETRTVTAERYFDQASLRILLSDNPADITNLPCVSSGAPFDLSQMAINPVSTWSTSSYAPLVTLYNNLTKNKVIPLPLAASGATGGSVYNYADGYWLPAGYPIIKGFLKIEEQTSYGNASGCGSWTDVTTEVLGYGYVGRNIDPVPQSFNGTSLNPQWPGTTTQMQPTVTPALPYLPNAQIATQNQTATLLKTGITVTAIDTLGAGSPAGMCPDPHPYAIIRLERIRDNPSSVYFNSGALTAATKTTAGHYPYQSTVGEVCGIDPANYTQLAPTRNAAAATGGIVGNPWAPQPYDFWPNVLFDTREGELREKAMSTATPPQPTLNGAMSYIEVDGKNLANWFAGSLNGISTSGPNTKDPNNASNDFVLYISDRRGNYEDPTVQTITGGWPPLSYTNNETGESGWTDIVNGPGSAQAGCPSATLDPGEDENTGTKFAGSLYYYGASQKYIHGAVTSPFPPSTSLSPGQLGIFSTLLAANGLAANSNCAAVPSYSKTDNIWPMMVATTPNAPRENPPLFFRRAIKIVDANNLTALGTCPGGNSCGLTIATENPAYVQGDYNANSANGGFKDPEVASSISADAVTLLSKNWNDVNSFSTPYALGNRAGTTSYYRMAVLAGVNVSFTQPGGATTTPVPQDFGTDGGVHNFLRYVENWGGQQLNYLGSIVELYYSRQANGTYKCCTTVYSPPTRGYNFDTNFLNPLLLPPRTPLFRDVNTTGWTRLLLPSQ